MQPDRTEQAQPRVRLLAPKVPIWRRGGGDGHGHGHDRSDMQAGGEDCCSLNAGVSHSRREMSLNRCSGGCSDLDGQTRCSRQDSGVKQEINDKW